MKVKKIVKELKNGHFVATDYNNREVFRVKVAKASKKELREIAKLIKKLNLELLPF